MNIPNWLTFFRLFLVPVVIWAISRADYPIAFCAFAIAGVTDALDGIIARKFNMQTELGAYLDPLADKMLLISIYITLGLMNFLPIWLTLLVVSRDIMIMGGVQISSLMGKPLDIRPNFISKINTTLQISFAGIILGSLALKINLILILEISIWLVAISTLISGLVYIGQWLNHMHDE